MLGGACIWREPCVSKSARLILGGKFASEKRLGWLIVERKFMSVILQKDFTDTNLEDVDLSKTQPFKYFVYMDRGNQNQEWRGITQTAIKCDTFWLQSFGTRHSCLANTKILCYCTVFALFYYFIFEGNFQVLTPGGLYSKGRLKGGFFAFFGILRYLASKLSISSG